MWWTSLFRPTEEDIWSKTESSTVLSNTSMSESPLSTNLEKEYDHEYDYESLPEGSSLLAQLTAGAFAGILEHTVMYPVDVIKTRNQVYLEQKPPPAPTGSNYLKSTLKPSGSIGIIPASTKNLLFHKSGIIPTLHKISTTEGPAALWRGVSSVLVGAGPAHAVYFTVFEYVKTTLVSYFGKDGLPGKRSFIVTHENHPLIASIGGIAATTASDFFMTPFDILKQRMQIGKSLEIRTPPENSPIAVKRSPRTPLLHTVRSIIKHEGPLTFWVSYPATLLLNIPSAALNFGVYEYVSLILRPILDPIVAGKFKSGDSSKGNSSKEHKHLYNPLLHCVSGTFAGVVSSALTNPLDVVKTFLQTQYLSSDPNIRAIHRRWWTVVKFLSEKENGGYRNFARGLRARIVVCAPGIGVSWVGYEMAKWFLT
ncbi:hypothetical protein DASC09_058280 [Saccharomycopsis crataegensis]|uniref:Mitochondrial carrier n=1 Tax=Saccharomycopsis crataegensis TaxID=43959 RepID=A0AAV5QVE6_9ASCO|nr:hypothetical protein DASC09_058280 [Saccharomycopsis crataegensis]